MNNIKRKKYLLLGLVFTLSLTLLLNISSYSYADNNLIDGATNIIEDAANAGVDKVKSEVDKYFEENNIDVSHYVNRTWYEKLWDKIKAFFKNLFKFLVHDSKSDLLDTANEEIVKAANGLSNNALDSISNLASDNLDIASQGVLSSMIDNAKNMSEEERINNIIEVENILTDTAGKLINPVGSELGTIAENMSYTFDANNISGSSFNPSDIINSVGNLIK